MIKKIENYNFVSSNIQIISLLFFVFIIINCLRLYVHPYTLEWNFIELSNYFVGTNNFFDISKFKVWQANTTFYSLIISIFNFVPEKFFLFLARCLNLLLLYFCILHIAKNFSENFKLSFLIIVSLIILNPVYNTYIFRIYPDILSACCFYLALSFYYQKKMFQTYSFFLISVLIKPVAIIFSFMFLLANYKKLKFNKKTFIQFANVSFLVFFSLSIYLLFIFGFEKIIFSNKVGSSYLDFNIYNSMTNFFRYLIYSFLLLGPFNLILFFMIIKKINFKNNFFLILLSFFFSSIIVTFFNINSSYGELNLGFINSIIGKKINFINIIILFFANLTIFLSYHNFKKYRFILLLFLFSLLILSIFIHRPAQRYIMYIYPIFVLYVTLLIDFKKKSFIKISFISLTILFYLTVNFLQFYVQQQKIIVFEELFLEIKNKKLVNDTYPGILAGSHGHYFYNYLMKVHNTEDHGSYKYKITTSNNCNNKNSLILKNLNSSFYNFKVCLNKN